MMQNSDGDRSDDNNDNDDRNDDEQLYERQRKGRPPARANIAFLVSSYVDSCEGEGRRRSRTTRTTMRVAVCIERERANKKESTTEKERDNLLRRKAVVRTTPKDFMPERPQTHSHGRGIWSRLEATLYQGKEM